MSQTPPTDPGQDPSAPPLAETAVLPDAQAANDTVPYPAGSLSAAPVGAAPTPPGFPVAPPRAEPTLSGFMRASIVMLCVVSVAAIVLLFLGDFEGKAIRLVSTIVLFGVFTVFTAVDTRRGDRQLWYAPVALIGNTYVLGLSLIVVWVTRYEPFVLGLTIFWKSLFIILVIRGVIFGAEMLLRFVGEDSQLLSLSAFVTCVLATIAAIMFTAPEAVQSFRMSVPDLYWKFAVSFLILTALGLAVTMLLRWTFTADDRAAERSARAERARFAPNAHPVVPRPVQQAPFAQSPAGGDRPPFGQAPLPIPAPAPVPMPIVPPVPQAQPQPQQVLLPWPTYPNGAPLPQLPNGQPDFQAAQQQI